MEEMEMTAETGLMVDRDYRAYPGQLELKDTRDCQAFRDWKDDQARQASPDPRDSSDNLDEMASLVCRDCVERRVILVPSVVVAETALVEKRDFRESWAKEGSEEPTVYPDSQESRVPRVNQDQPTYN